MDTEYMGGTFYKNVVKFQKNITFNQLKGIFGVTTSDNCGKIAYPAIQAAPSFANSFPHIFGDRNDLLCLIPQGIEQDPYFRMTRRICAKIKYPKPACIHTKFVPGIQGVDSKMNSSVPNSAIFLTDSASEIENKIKKYPHSGGGKTLEEHRTYGANLEVDIPYQYLRLFEDDDAKLEEIGVKYSKGEITTSEVKNTLIAILQKVVLGFQEKRAKVTDADVKLFMERRPLKF